MISLRLFGGASLERDGEALSGPPGRRHPLALLAILCVSHPQPLSRDKLMGYLWPERGARGARKLLNQAVHVLRKALGEDVLLSAGDDLRLGSPPLECDVLAFEDALSAGDRARATALYAGPLLDGFFLGDAAEFEHWLDQERERFRRAWRKALGELADERLAAGHADAAGECWRHLLLDDPYDARATLGLMEALVSVGDRVGAIRQARLHELLLQEEFGAEPDPAVVAFADRIRAGEGERAAESVDAAESEDATASFAVGPGEEGGIGVAGSPGAVASPRSRRPRERTGSRYGGPAALAADLEAASTDEPTAIAAVAPTTRSGRRRIWLAVPLIVAAALAAFNFLLQSRPGPPSPEHATIAVLPFRPVGDDVDAIAAGITIATRDRLAVVEGIDVVGDVSSAAEGLSDAPAPRISQALGADYILRAVVERNAAANRIEVRPELYGANGTRIRFWAGDPISVSAANLSRVETTIAGDVVQALDLTIGEAARANLTPPQASPAAYEAYLRSTQESGDARRALLQEAIVLDSTFAPALALLAHAAILRFMETRSAGDSAEADRLARAAIRHGGQHALSQAVMGVFHRSVTQDLDSALVYFGRARALAPGNAAVIHFLASVLWTSGDLDSALVEAERGAALDRLSASAVSRVSRILLWQHRLDEAWRRHLEARPLALRGTETFVLMDGPLIQAARGSLDSARALTSRIVSPRRRSATAAWAIDNDLLGWLVDDSLALRVCRDKKPGSAAFVWSDRRPHDRLIGCALEEWTRGDSVRAVAMADSARGLFRSLLADRPGDERFRMRLAYADFLLGDRDRALAQADSSIAILNTYWDFIPGALNAIAFARLAGLAGDAGRAVSELRPMVDGYSPVTRNWLRVDPAFDRIRSAPAFRELMEGARR